MATLISPRLTVEEAAAAAHNHPQTVYKALDDGTLHGSQRSKGGRWRIKPECLEAWMDGKPCEHKANVSPIRRRA